MAVLLRIWAFKPWELSIGHASLEVGPEQQSCYMSVWPSGNQDDKGTGVTKKFDFEQEGGDAWYQDMFLNLDEHRMIEYWNRLQSTNSLTYSRFVYGFNCMTNAAMLLTCGAGSDPIEEWYRFATIHDHWSLMLYATAMKTSGW